MGFMDKAKRMAEQAQAKLDEVQKDFNSSNAPASPSGPITEYDKHGRPIPPEGGVTPPPDPMVPAPPPPPARRPTRVPPTPLVLRSLRMRNRCSTRRERRERDQSYCPSTTDSTKRWS